ncbi:hypothetical protein DXZ20_04665 [Leptolyngbyaceae cyanobacterium CCMR0081]|uniref:Uncharacterized protein n=1 Tax=Adonisia turfae CCMR0081 TaxID=2292702 RepID=A0A6M0RGY1_9CYAN|nr:hypothetical protein [Adonisia turfae CCMR0081]
MKAQRTESLQAQIDQFEFPSPFGVYGMKAQRTESLQAQIDQFEFPSPFGVYGMKDPLDLGWL